MIKQKYQLCARKYVFPLCSSFLVLSFSFFFSISMHFFSFHLNLTTWRKKYRGNYSLWLLTAFYCGRKMLHAAESSRQESPESVPSINAHDATIAWKLTSENWFHGLLHSTLLCCHLLICQWSQTNDTYDCDTDNLDLPSAHSKQGQDAVGMTIHGAYLWSMKQ